MSSQENNLFNLFPQRILLLNIHGNKVKFWHLKNKKSTKVAEICMKWLVINFNNRLSW